MIAPIVYRNDFCNIDLQGICRCAVIYHVNNCLKASSSHQSLYNWTGKQERRDEQWDHSSACDAKNSTASMIKSPVHCWYFFGEIALNCFLQQTSATHLSYQDTGRRSHLKELLELSWQVILCHTSHCKVCWVLISNDSWILITLRIADIQPYLQSANLDLANFGESKLKTYLALLQLLISKHILAVQEINLSNPDSTQVCYLTLFQFMSSFPICTLSVLHLFWAWMLMSFYMTPWKKWTPQSCLPTYVEKLSISHSKGIAKLYRNIIKRGKKSHLP